MTGYFGKVSTHGDFVGRRLPPETVQRLDQWLQACLQASRARLGDAWLTVYLTSPVWRFALGPGVLDAQGWGGVLMPSVDRVGRHFPLVLAAAGDTALYDWPRTQAAWYDALEDLARASLAPSFQLTQFDAMPDPVLRPAPARWRSPLGADCLSALACSPLPGHSLWWSEGSQQVEPSLLVCAGLPAPDSYAAMLDGTWAAHGWATPA